MIKLYEKPKIPEKITECKLITDDRKYSIEKVYFFESKEKLEINNWGDYNIKDVKHGRKEITGYFPLNKEVYFLVGDNYNNKYYKITGWKKKKIYYELNMVSFRGRRGEYAKFFAKDYIIDKSELIKQYKNKN